MAEPPLASYGTVRERDGDETGRETSCVERRTVGSEVRDLETMGWSGGGETKKGRQVCRVGGQVPGSGSS